MADFKNSGVYMQGKFYAALGKLLMNPKSTVSDIADFEVAYGVDLGIHFRQAATSSPAVQAGTAQGETK